MYKLAGKVIPVALLLQFMHVSVVLRIGKGYLVAIFVVYLRVTNIGTEDVDLEIAYSIETKLNVK